jgi:muconolactone D-isomerase
MLFFLQMKWNVAGRLSFDEIWKLEVEEAAAAQGHFKVLSMYKVAGQQRVISIVEMESADELDRAILGRLPLREYLDFEAIWPLRTFEAFVEDCKTGFGDSVPNSARKGKK